MGILVKDVVYKCDGNSNLQHIKRRMEDLQDGEYAIYICDKSKSKTLPQLKYYFGVILRGISEVTGYTQNELYRFFEKEFCPMNTIEIQGKEVVIQDFKSLSSKAAGEVIERVIQWAGENLGLEFESREDLKDKDAEEAYVGAYNDQWQDFNTDKI